MDSCREERREGGMEGRREGGREEEPGGRLAVRLWQSAAESSQSNRSRSGSSEQRDEQRRTLSRFASWTWT